MNILNFLFWTSRETMCVVDSVTCSFLLLILNTVIYFFFSVEVKKKTFLSAFIWDHPLHLVLWYKACHLFCCYFLYNYKTQRIFFSSHKLSFQKQKDLHQCLELQFMIVPQWNNLLLLIIALSLYFFTYCHLMYCVSVYLDCSR